MMHDKPLVTVKVITYNHEKYIRQCLDGILMQKVNFPYEIVIHDDASPDGTADIIREYEAKYPDIIKPIYQTENQYSQGNSIGKILDEFMRGKYIAHCEGDDYWIDPNKLQMQVDFLEEHPEFVGTAHKICAINENGPIINNHRDFKSSNNIFTKNDLEFFRIAGQTASLVYINIFSQMDQRKKDRYYSLPGPGDRKINLLLILEGEKIYCFKNIMSVYRNILIGTSWSATNKNKNRHSIVQNYLLHHMKFAHEEYNVCMCYHEFLIRNICKAILRYIHHFENEDKHVLLEIIREIKNNKKYFQLYLKKCICHPLLMVKRIYPIITKRFRSHVNKLLIIFQK